MSGGVLSSPVALQCYWLSESSGHWCSRWCSLAVTSRGCSRWPIGRVLITWCLGKLCVVVSRSLSREDAPATCSQLGTLLYWCYDVKCCITCCGIIECFEELLFQLDISALVFCWERVRICFSFKSSILCRFRRWRTNWSCVQSLIRRFWYH
jgi:hypothetical protein